MRFTYKGWLKTSSIIKQKQFRNILMTNLNLTSTDMDKFFDTNKYALSVFHHRIIKNCLICQVRYTNITY